MTRLRIVALVLLSAGIALRAQNPPAPSFEVASVKPNNSGDDRSFINLGAPPPAGAVLPPGFGPPGRVTVTNGQLRTIIGQAFEIPTVMQRFVLTGGPEKVLSARFDIAAKLPDNTSRAQTLQMLRALLEDRFRLKTHKETRSIPIYAITVMRDEKLGSDMRPTSVDCAALRAAGLTITDSNRPLDSKGRDFQEQLGLKLEPRMSPFELLVIDSVEMPTPD